jgi:putative DNA primase/helicase
MPDPSRNPFLEARNAGLSPIPCDVFTKRPQLSWKRYQSSIADVDECIEWYARNWALGIVCGEVSNRLVAIDIEGSFAPQLPALAERLRRAGAYDAFQSWVNGYCETTPRGGRHVLVHIAGDGPIDGNAKLAVAADGRVLIETRGEGGYVIVAPSPGYTLTHGNFDQIAWAPLEEWWSR